MTDAALHSLIYCMYFTTFCVINISYCISCVLGFWDVVKCCSLFSICLLVKWRQDGLLAITFSSLAVETCIYFWMLFMFTPCSFLHSHSAVVGVNASEPIPGYMLCWILELSVHRLKCSFNWLVGWNIACLCNFCSWMLKLCL